MADRKPGPEMRYLYIKNGDVIEQLESLEKISGPLPESGPDAFLASFLQAVDGSPVLLISAKKSRPPYTRENIRARVFQRSDRLQNFFTGLPGRIAMMAGLLVEVIPFKPQRILCGCNGPLLWLSWFLATARRIPLVCSRHNGLFISSSGMSQLPRRIDLRVLKKSRAVVCHGPFLRHELEELGVASNKIVEFDSKVSLPSSLPEQVADLRRSPDQKIIVFLGRLEVEKGVLDLFRACRERLLADDRLLLIYIGGGKALAQLEQETAEAGCREKVRLMGKITHDRINGLLQQADILVAPTRSSFPEGRCMAVMEGMACGLPVVAPDFGPFPFLVKPGQNGYLYEPDSVIDLRQKIFAILDNPESAARLREGATASTAALEKAAVSFGEAVKTAFAKKRT